MRPIGEIACGLWPTPCAVDRVRSDETMAKCAEFRKRNAGQNTVPLYLGEVAMRTALWQTPVADDAVDRAKGKVNSRGEPKLSGQVVAHGQTQDGSSAPTEKPGALNPAFVCWLMGFPVEWLFCAPRDKAVPRSLKSIGTTASAP
jgi:hypothetical protein